MKKFVIALIVTGALLACEGQAAKKPAPEPSSIPIRTQPLSVTDPKTLLSLAAAASVQPSIATQPNTQVSQGQKRKHSDDPQQPQVRTDKDEKPPMQNPLASSSSTQSTGTSDSNNNAQEPDPKRQKTGTAPPSSSSSSATSTVALPSTASASASNTTNIIYDEQSFVAAVKSGDLTTVKLSFDAVKDNLEICKKALKNTARKKALKNTARNKETAPGDHTGIAKFLLDQNINFDAAVIVLTLKASLVRNRHALVQYILDKGPDIALKDVGSFFVDAVYYQKSTIVQRVFESKYATRIPTLFLRTASQMTSLQIIKDKIAEHLKKRKAQEQAQTSTGADTKTSSSSSSTSSTSSSASASSSSSSASSASTTVTSSTASNTATITYDEKSFVSAVTNGDLASVKLSFDAVKDDLKTCEKAFTDAALAGSTDIADFLDEKIKFDNATIARILSDAATNNHPVLVYYLLDKKPDLDSEHVSNALTSSARNNRPKVVDLLLNSKHAQKISASSLKIAMKSTSSPIKNKIAKHLEKREAKKLAQTNTGTDTKTSSGTSSASSSSSNSSSATNVESNDLDTLEAAINLKAAIKMNRKKVVQDFLNKESALVFDPVCDALKCAIAIRRPKMIDLLFEEYAQRIPTTFLERDLKEVVDATSERIKNKIARYLEKRKAKEQAQTSTETDTKVPSSTSSTSSTSSSSSSSSLSAATPSASNTASITCSKKSVAVAATTGNLSAFIEAAKNNRKKVVQDFLDKKDPEIDSNDVGYAFQRAAGQQRSKIVDLFLNNPMYEKRIPTSSLEAVLGNAKSKPIKEKITKCLAEREATKQAQTNTLTAAINGDYDTIKLIIDTASHELTQHTIGQALLFSIVHDHEKVSELLISHNATNATVKIAAAAYEDAFYAASIFERNKVVKLFLKYHVNGPIKIGSFCLLRARSIIRDETLKQFIFSQFGPQTRNVASASSLALLANTAVASTAPPSNSTNAKK